VRKKRDIRYQEARGRGAATSDREARGSGERRGRFATETRSQFTVHSFGEEKSEEREFNEEFAEGAEKRKKTHEEVDSRKKPQAQNLHCQISRPHRRQQRPPLITAERDEMQVSTPRHTLEVLRHNKAGGRAHPLPKPQRVGHPMFAVYHSPVTFFSDILPP